MPTTNDPQKPARYRNKYRTRLRAQLTDPLSGSRLNVYGDTPEALAHRVNRINAIRDDLRAGVITREEAARQMRPYARGPLTVGTAFERYIATLKPESARIANANWRARLAPYFADLSPLELTRERMAAWQVTLQKRGDASKTLKNSYDHLAACCRLLVDGGELDGLPWGDISRHQGGTGWRPDKATALRQMRAVVTVDQLAALIMAARAVDLEHWKAQEYSDQSYKVALLCLTGLRQAEAAALSWQNIALDNEIPMLIIDRQAKRGWNQRSNSTAPREPTKTRTARSQRLHPSAVKVLEAQRLQLQRFGWYKFEGPVFPGKDGKFRTSGVVLKPDRMRAYARAAGFPFWEEWVTHSTRHSFASLEVIASRGNLKATQARTGHSDVRQLERYLHAAGNFLGESAVPEVHLDPPVIAQLPDGQGDIVKADPWGFDWIEGAPPVELVTLKAARDYEVERKQKKAEEDARLARPFSELAAEWLAGGLHAARGKIGMRPPEVVEAGRRAYMRNYRDAERGALAKGAERPEAKKAAQRKGVRGRIAVYAAWEKALKAALRRPHEPLPLSCLPPRPPRKSP